MIYCYFQILLIWHIKILLPVAELGFVWPETSNHTDRLKLADETSKKITIVYRISFCLAHNLKFVKR